MFNFHSYKQRYAYPSRRSLAYGSRGMVCTASRLAAEAGLDMLKAGGNAADASVANAICLTVIEPVSNGIGSDAFAIVWMKNKMYGLNSSGWSPKNLTGELLRSKGLSEMPLRGWCSVTVPGAPAAWSELSARFGKLPFEKLFEPAVSYAEKGYAVSNFVAGEWKKEFEDLKKYKNDPAFQGYFETFAKEGRTPLPGELYRLPDHGKTLRKLAETHCKDFYRGDLAERIVQFSKETGGFIEPDDLEEWKPERVTPLSVNYHGYDVWELPPNGHGIVALMALNFLKNFRFEERDSGETLHYQMEAMKLAYATGQKYITDPKSMKISVEELLSDEYAAERTEEIGERAMPPQEGRPFSGGTVYLCTADEEGNMVSYIQSNYCHFGSGIVIPGTGIALQNRGSNFSLDPYHANCLEGRKRTYHTIIPGFLTKENRAIGPFGVMGGFMQPQGHLQILTSMIDFDRNPQEALDAPRWQWKGGMKFEMEPGFSDEIIEDLRKRGHEISINDDLQAFGRGEIICRNEKGVLAGATEPRGDGTAAAW